MACSVGRRPTRWSSSSKPGARLHSQAAVGEYERAPTLILVPREVAVPMLTEVSEYTGQRAIAVSCTQLGTGFTSSRARRVVGEWIELLSSRTPLTELRFTTRTPKRLFAGAGQSATTDSTCREVGRLRGLEPARLDDGACATWSCAAPRL